MTILKRTLLLLVTAVILFSCDGLLLSESPIGRENPNDPLFTSDDIGMGILINNDELGWGENYVSNSSVGGPISIAVTLVNNTDSDIEITSMYFDMISDPGSDNFGPAYYINDPYNLEDGFILPANGSQDFQLSLDPSVAAEYESHFVIETSNSVNPHIIIFKGYVEWGVSGESDILVRIDGFNYISEESTYDFGNIDQTSSASVNVDIFNASSDSTLEISSASLTVMDGFSMEDPGAFSVPPGEYANQSYLVTFESATEGDFSTELQVFSNDPDEGTYVITFQGTVVGGSGIDFSQSFTIDAEEYFDNDVVFLDGIAPNDEQYTYLQLTNSGSSNLYLGSISDIPDATNSITYDDSVNLPADVPAGGSISIPIMFSPSNTGAYSTTLEIRSGPDINNQEMTTINFEGICGTALTTTADIINLEAGEFGMITSNLTLDDDVILKVGATLAINRDITVNFSSNTMAILGSLIVQSGATLNLGTGNGLIIGHDGTTHDSGAILEAAGTQNSPVTIKIENYNAPLTNNAHVSLDHVILNHNIGYNYVSAIVGNSSGAMSSLEVTNCFIYNNSYNPAISVHDASGNLLFQNNVFYSLYNDPAINISSSDTHAVVIDFLYNTVYGDDRYGNALILNSDQSTRYWIHRNIFLCSSSAGYTKEIAIPSATPTVEIEENIYHSTGDFSDTGINIDLLTNLNLDTVNIAVSSVFTDAGALDFTLNANNGSYFPSQDSLTDPYDSMISSLSYDNYDQAGAYGNGGTPPAF